MKKRIAAAIAGQDADWTAQAMRFFKKEYYGPLDSPYQFQPSGTEQNFEGFTTGQVRDWYEKHVLSGQARAGRLRRHGARGGRARGPQVSRQRARGSWKLRRRHSAGASPARAANAGDRPLTSPT